MKLEDSFDSGYAQALSDVHDIRNGATEVELEENNQYEGVFLNDLSPEEQIAVLEGYKQALDDLSS